MQLVSKLSVVSLALQMNALEMNASAHFSSWCVALLQAPHSFGNGASSYGHMFGACIGSVSSVSELLSTLKWWTIQQLKRKELKMQRRDLYFIR